jgi:PAS domain-containing protein
VTLAAGLAITAMLVVYLLLSFRRTTQLERLAARFNAALDNMPHGLSLFDRQQRLIVFNRSYVRLTQ